MSSAKIAQSVGVAALAGLAIGVGVAVPGVADTVRPTPMTGWSNVSVSWEGIAGGAGKTQGQKKAYMTSDENWHSKANYNYRVTKHADGKDRGIYGRIDASSLIYKCQPMPGGNCVPGVARASAKGETSRMVHGSDRKSADAVISNMGRNERGGWKRSSSLCVDKRFRPDSCGNKINW